MKLIGSKECRQPFRGDKIGRNGDVVVDGHKGASDAEITRITQFPQWQSNLRAGNRASANQRSLIIPT